MYPRHRNLPLLLLHAREAAIGHFRPILKHFKLTDQQWRIIRVLSESPQALEPGQIAEACKILSPSLTGILSRLADMGLISREWSSVDQRKKAVALTAKGHALVDRITPLIDRQYGLIEDACGADELDSVYRLLDSLVALLNRDIPSVMSSKNNGPKPTATRARRKTSRTGKPSMQRPPHKPLASGAA